MTRQQGTPPQNHAVWLQAKQNTTMSINEASYPSVDTNELIVNAKAVAIILINHAL